MSTLHPFLRHVAWIPAALLLISFRASAATLPADFVETTVASGLSDVTAMDIAPDGRIFVCEDNGRLRVIQDDALLLDPFLTVNTRTEGERGLLGVAVDPGFPSVPHVYVYYTTGTPSPIHNRVSRFTAAGNTAVLGSEEILLELDPLDTIFHNHNGGALHFGPDGKLYVATGDSGSGASSQSLSSRHGKILRINPNGTLPSDNPFYQAGDVVQSAIWAHGLRNPFTFAFQPGTGKMFINDVGESTWEEINEGEAGANYGWSGGEDDTGPRNDPDYVDPVYAYHHEDGFPTGCSIIGGAFYNPVTPQFPAEYTGDYFFGDYCEGWIKRLDAEGGGIVDFSTGPFGLVDIRMSSGGDLYYLNREEGVLQRARYAGAQPQPPVISRQPLDITVTAGARAVFSVSASGNPAPSFRWQRRNPGDADFMDISGATAASYEIAAVGAGDDGAFFRCVVSNTPGTVTSAAALLTISGNAAPAGSITAPAVGARYNAGDTISFSGTGTDLEDGALPDGAFSWSIDFYHNDTELHYHNVTTLTGARSGSFTIPTVGERSVNTWFRLTLTLTDSDGDANATPIVREIFPRLSTMTFVTDPPGLAVRLEGGAPQAAPASLRSVVGFQRSFSVDSPQVLGARTYEFVSWSNGGPRSQNVPAPAAETVYTAVFRPVDAIPARPRRLWVR